MSQLATWAGGNINDYSLVKWMGLLHGMPAAPRLCEAVWGSRSAHGLWEAVVRELPGGQLGEAPHAPAGLAGPHLERRPGGPWEGEMLPLGPCHCLSKSFSMEPNRRRLPGAQEKWSQWLWASLSGQVLPLNLGWVFLVPTRACPPVMYTDIYRRRRGVPVPEVEGQSALGPGRAWGSAQGGG